MGLSRVVVQDGDRSSDMSVSAFLALPLDRRVQMVLEQQLQFYDEGGRRLSAAEGLRFLRGVREPAPASSR
jgi:hypothetical protein